MFHARADVLVEISDIFITFTGTRVHPHRTSRRKYTYSLAVAPPAAVSRFSAASHDAIACGCLTIKNKKKKIKFYGFRRYARRLVCSDGNVERVADAREKSRSASSTRWRRNSRKRKQHAAVFGTVLKNTQKAVRVLFFFLFLGVSSQESRANNDTDRRRLIVLRPACAHGKSETERNPPHGRHDDIFFP